MSDQYNWDAAYAKMTRNNAAASNMAAATNVPPQDATDALTKGAAVGVPPSTGMVKPQTGNTIYNNQQQAQVLGGSPPVKNWVAKSPAHAAASQDDLAGLADVAGMAKSVGSGLLNTLMSFSDAVGNPTALIGQGFDMGSGLLGQDMTDARRMFFGQTTTERQQTAGLYHEPEGFFQRLAENVGGSLPYLPLGVVAAIKATAGSMIGSEGARALGLSPAWQGLAGLVGGAVGGLHGGEKAEPPGTEYGTDEAGNRLTFDSPQSAVMWAAHNAPKPDQKLVIETMKDGRIGWRVTQAASIGTPPPGMTPESDALLKQNAGLNAQGVADLQAKIAETKTQGRAPQLMQEFLEDQGMGDQYVYVPTDKLAELVSKQTIKLSDLQELAGGDRAELNRMAQAAGRGQEYMLPLSRYLAATSGKGFADALNDITRFTTDSISTDEGKGMGVSPGEEAIPKEGEAPPAEKEVVPGTEKPEPLMPEDEKLSKEEQQTLEDHMPVVATAVAQASKEVYLQGLFSEAAALGMNKAQLEGWSAKLKAAQEAISKKTVDFVVRQLKSKRTKEWNETLAQKRAEVEQEFAGQKEHQARYGLAFNTGVLGEPLEQPPIKLSRESVRAEYGDTVADSLPRTYFGKDGGSATDVGQAFGYDNGDQLIQDLRAMELDKTFGEDASLRAHTARLIKDEAMTRTEKELGFDISPERLLDEARSQVNGPAIEDLLTDRLKALSEAIPGKPPFNKWDILANAQQAFEDLPLMKAVNLKALEKDVYNHARKVEELLRSGKPQDLIDAFQHLQNQLLAHYTFRMGVDLAQKWRRYNTEVQAWKRNDLAQTIAPEFANQMHGLLRAIGMTLQHDDVHLNRFLMQQPYVNFVEKWNNAGYDFDSDPLPVKGKLKDGTAAEFEAFYDNMKGMWKAGKNIQDDITFGSRLKMQQQILKAVLQLERRPRVLTREELEHPTFLQKGKAALRDFGAWMLRLEQLMRNMDYRDPDGAFNQTVMLPLEERKNWSVDASRKLAQHWGDLGSKFEDAKGFRESLDERIADIKAKFPSLVDYNGDSVFNTIGDVVTAALNWGNVSNRRAMIEGFKSENVTSDTFDRLFKEYLGKDHWTFVQGVWDAYGLFKKDLFDMYERIRGIPMPEITATPFENEHGSFAGGYYPIVRDPRGLPPEAQELNVDKFMGNTEYRRALPENRHSKVRTGLKSMLNFQMDNAKASIGQIIHDIAYREVLMSSDKFFGDPLMQNAITRHIGPEYWGKIRAALVRTAAGPAFGMSQNATFLRLMEGANKGALLNTIGYSLETVLKHGPTAFMHSVGQVGAVNMAQAARDMLRNPRDIWNYTMMNSAETRNRVLNVSENAREVYLSLVEKGQDLELKDPSSWLNFVHKHAFDMVAGSDQFSAVMAWWASYNKFMFDDDRPHEEAVALADQTVRQAHGSVGITDSAPFLQVPRSAPELAAVWRSMNALMNFFSHTWNVATEIPQDLFGTEGYERNIPLGLRKLSCFVVATVAIEKWVEELFYDKPVSWLEAMMNTATSMVPFAKDTLDALEGKDVKSHFLALRAPIAAGKTAISFLKGEPDKVVEGLYDTFGAVLGLPEQAGKVGQYLYDTQNGDVPPPHNPWEFVHGLGAGPQGVVPQGRPPSRTISMGRMGGGIRQ